MLCKKLNHKYIMVCVFAQNISHIYKHTSKSRPILQLRWTVFIHFNGLEMCQIHFFRKLPDSDNDLYLIMQ